MDVKNGDYVEIVNDGQIYLNYDTLALKHGFHKFRKGTDAINGEKGKVLKIVKHLVVDDENIYILRMKNKIILISESGIKKLDI